jgi:pentatricopeptide repeat protein
MEMEADVDVGLHDNDQNSQFACKNLNITQIKEDGDDHLQLVKRARVTMGKQSSLEEEHNNFTRAEERRPNKVAFNAMEEDNSFFQLEERTSFKGGVNTLEPISSSSTEFYSLMRKEGVMHVSSIFTVLFKACCAKMDVGLGRQIHGQMILVRGFGEDLHGGNSMIDMYIKCGFLECGRKVFDEMPNRNVIFWTELISAYGKSRNMESAGELFDH